MQGKLTLLGCGSPNVQKVMLMLAECGLEHEFREVDLYDGSLADPEFRAMAPNGRLPVLIDDGVPVFESGAILIHLAEKTGRLLPAGGTARGEVMQWLMWQMAGIGPMFGQALHFRFIRPEGNDYARGRYWREVNRLYDVAEARLAVAPWLGGADYSIADIAAVPWLKNYAKTLEIDLATRPRVAGWCEAIAARPAWEAIQPAIKTMFKAGLARQKRAEPAQLARFYGQEAPA